MSGFSDSGSAGWSSDSGGAWEENFSGGPSAGAQTTYFSEGGRMSWVGESRWPIDYGMASLDRHSQDLGIELEDVKTTIFAEPRYLDVESNSWVSEKFLIHGKIEGAYNKDSYMDASAIGEGKNVIFVGARDWSGKKVFQGGEGVDIMIVQGGGTNILRGEGGDDIFYNLRGEKVIVYGGPGANNFSSTRDDRYSTSRNEWSRLEHEDQIHVLPDGKTDIIEGLDYADKIFFEGVSGNDLEFAENVSYTNSDGVTSTGIGIYHSGRLEALVKLDYRAPDEGSYDERHEIGINTLKEVALAAGGSSSAIFTFSSSDGSASSTYLRSDLVESLTWSDTVRINLEKTGSTSDSVIQAKQVEKSQYDSGFVGSIVTGTSSDDIVRGLAGFDQLLGKAGDDLIHGGNGRDIIDGGTGSDELHGDFGWNTFKDQQDGSKDLIAIKSDQHLSNFWYGKAGNSPNGEKADFIEGLDASDEIKIIGVFTPDISVVDNVTARGVTGIGIYAKGTLEAVYTGGNLSRRQIQNMTTGDGSTTAMNNQMWSYWGDNTVPPLQT
tara:strand:- start:180 stop:1829 length:1650 start_codon:yes stop_codon:yes gene_type:complete